MRKYDFLAGRFSSPDPLWEKYVSVTPYNYCNNNPMGSVDVTGKAQFVMNYAKILDDGVDDGIVYATSENAYDNSRSTWDEGKQKYVLGSEVDFNTLKNLSNELPDKLTRKDILDKNYSHLQGEGGGVGILNHYFFGGYNNDPGENKGPFERATLGEATDNIMSALADAISGGFGGDIAYFVHDHMFGASEKPSKPDATTTLNYFKENCNPLFYGIVLQGDNVNIFTGNDGKDQVNMSRELFETLGK